MRACASFLRKRVTWFKVGWTLVRKLQGHVPVNTRNWRAIDKSTQARLAESFHSTAAELTWLDRTKRSNCCPARYHLNECREESATTRMCLALLRQYCQHQHKYQEWQNLDTTKLHHLWTGISPWLMNVFLLEELISKMFYIYTYSKRTHASLHTIPNPKATVFMRFLCQLQKCCWCADGNSWGIQISWLLAVVQF